MCNHETKNIWYVHKETIPSGVRQVLFLNEQGFLIRFLACNKIGLGQAIGKYYTSHVHLPPCHRTILNAHAAEEDIQAETFCRHPGLLTNPT